MLIPIHSLASLQMQTGGDAHQQLQHINCNMSFYSEASGGGLGETIEACVGIGNLKFTLVYTSNGTSNSKLSQTRTITTPTAAAAAN